MFETLTAEIIAIGSELLAPDRTDTNSLWLTEKLNRLGIEVKLKTIVGDDDARLEETIKDAVRRSKVVITTGGLGPTEDDITRKITARALGRRLLLDEDVLAEIRQRFQSFGVTMPERNSRQAMVIEDAVVPQSGVWNAHDIAMPVNYWPTVALQSKMKFLFSRWPKFKKSRVKR